MPLQILGNGQLCLDHFTEQEIRYEALGRLMLNHQKEFDEIFKSLREERIKIEMHTYTWRDFLDSV